MTFRFGPSVKFWSRPRSSSIGTHFLVPGVLTQEQVSHAASPLTCDLGHDIKLSTGSSGGHLASPLFPKQNPCEVDILHALSSCFPPSGWPKVVATSHLDRDVEPRVNMVGHYSPPVIVQRREQPSIYPGRAQGSGLRS